VSAGFKHDPLLSAFEDKAESEYRSKRGDNVIVRRNILGMEQVIDLDNPDKCPYAERDPDFTHLRRCKAKTINYSGRQQAIKKESKLCEPQIYVENYRKCEIYIKEAEG
jgi:hypothetical protein